MKKIAQALFASCLFFFLAGCSSSFYAALDAAAGGGLCSRAADGTEIIQEYGYTFTAGGHGDYWGGNLNNYGSDATIRCWGEYEDGDVTASVYAAPNKKTGWKNLGPMVGQEVYFWCQEWSRDVWTTGKSGHYHIEAKIHNGKKYLRVRNKINYRAKSTCKIIVGGRTLADARIPPNGVTEWVESPGRDYKAGCLL